jgi:hypothetical protein
MKPDLRSLPLEQVAPGMYLGGDVCDSHGAVLLVAGTQLDESHIASLGRRGVQAVIIAQTETLSQAELAARRDAARVRLAHLFRHRPATETDRWLHQALLEYHMGKLQ